MDVVQIVLVLVTMPRVVLRVVAFVPLSVDSGALLPVAVVTADVTPTVLVPPIQEKSYSGITSRVTIVYFIHAFIACYLRNFSFHIFLYFKLVSE